MMDPMEQAQEEDTGASQGCCYSMSGDAVLEQLRVRTRARGAWKRGGEHGAPPRRRGRG